MADLNQLDKALTSILEDSWEIFWKDALLYLIAALLYLTLVACSLGLFTGIATVGYCLLIQKRRAGEDAGVLTLLSGFRYAIPATLAMIVIGAGVALGLLLLLLPGLFLLAAWSFTFYAMAAEDFGAGAALGRSYGIFKEHALLVVVILIVLGVINSIAATVIVGQLLTLPFGLIAMALAYERLSPSRLPEGGAVAEQPFGVP